MTLQTADPTLGELLQMLTPRAAGVAFVEVTDLKDVDMRPRDGPLLQEVHLRVLRGTGATLDRVNIIKAAGGHPAPNSPPYKPHGPVSLDTFKKGERYWVAFGSQYDWERCPQGVVNVWPDKDAPKLFDEAIRTDHYARRPQYEPKSGFTHSYRIAKDNSTWSVRMERDGKQLWEVKLPGEKYKGEMFDGEWHLLHRDQWPSGLDHAPAKRSGRYLFAETTTRLEPANGYGLPTEPHRLTYALDADTGKAAAVWVSIMRLGPTSTPSMIQYFDLKTSKIRPVECFGLFDTGGLAAGAKEERWHRKLVRVYDPNTGQLETEKAYRHSTGPGGSEYVPVNSK